MFGVGKLIGGALNAVGLGKIAPFVSLAVNAFTGNWAGVAMDVAGLAARIAPNSGFAKLVSKAAPIASAFMGGGGFAGGIGNLFQGGRIGELFTKFKDVQSSFQAVKTSTGLFDRIRKINDAFQTAKSFVDDLKAFQNNSLNAHRQINLGNVFRG